MYNEKPNKSNAEVALALLESGIIEPIDVLAKAKGVVGASFFTRFALVAQALGFLYSFFVRWRENARISPLELIASYYALVILRRSVAHLLGIMYDIRKPLLIHLDIHKVHRVSTHSSLSSPHHISEAVETSRAMLFWVLLLALDILIIGIIGVLFAKAFQRMECTVQQGNHRRLDIVPLMSFGLLLLGNYFQLLLPKWNLLKIARVFSMAISLSTAIGFTCYLWERCYDKRISPKFSLPYFQ